MPPRAPQLLAAHDLGPFLAHAPQPAPEDAAAPGRPPQPSPDLAAGRIPGRRGDLAATADRLLAALATQPAALRKSGGLAVREIKRLAKAAGATEPHTRLLLDLALAADLIALTRSPSGITALPTGAYDDWLARPPGARLAPLLAAWSGLWDIPTHTPAGETPTALVRGHDRHAPALRHALLAALAAVPLDGGSALPPLPFTEPPRQETGTRTPWEDLLGAADWHRPLAVTRQPMAGERAAHTLHEAACLGLVAHGTLTSLGRALLADPRSLDEPLGDLLPPLLEQAHFQADLTAVVPGRPTAALQELLTAAADRESEGHAVTWRFTPRSVRRALDAGHRAATLLDDLARVSATGTLPQPLGYLVRDAARSHGRMRVLSAACCIRSDDEALVEELAAHRDLRDLGLRVIAPTVLVSSRRRPPPWTRCAPRAMRRPWNPTPAPPPSNASPPTGPRPPPLPATPTHRSPSPTASWGCRHLPRPPRSVTPDPLPGRGGGLSRQQAAPLVRGGGLSRPRVSAAPPRRYDAGRSARSRGGEASGGGLCAGRGGADGCPGADGAARAWPRASPRGRRRHRPLPGKRVGGRRGRPSPAAGRSACGETGPPAARLAAAPVRAAFRSRPSTAKGRRSGAVGAKGVTTSR
ncbi:helicase-associated domain-containing protein [Streptomyces lydicus]|nr:helicase-associated domain-containing protein [Streptomyces lydicus]